ncbi:MAG: FtsX-like permease family protein [Pseudomonadota bacterium]
MKRSRLSFALRFGALMQQKGRLLLSLVAIALGVALGYAVELVNRSAVEEFGLAVRSLTGEADLIVRAGPGGLDESWYPRIARLPEVANASPVVEAQAKVPGERESLRLLGLDVMRAGAFGRNLLADDADRLDALRPDTVFLSAAAAARLGKRRGDTLHIQSGMTVRTLRVAGVFAGERSAYAWMDIAGAQTLLDRLGRIDRIDLRLRTGTDRADFAGRLARMLPAGAIVERPEQTVRRHANLSRAYRVNLNVLALVALFTGGLLVFSTQALGIVRRRAQLALLRVLGVTRAGLVRTLLGEALLVGMLGAGAGLALGYAAALAVLRHVGADLGAGVVDAVDAQVHPDPLATLLFFGAGVGAALLGSLAPALEAARASPAAALKAGDEQRSFARLRNPAPALAVLALGASACLLPPVDGLPLFGYAAIALLLIGTILLLPYVAATVYRRLPMPGRPAAQLALAQLRGAPGQVMLSLAAIVASVSLFVSMAIMVHSFRVSLAEWLDQVLPADLYVRVSAGSDTAYLTPAEQARLAALPDVRAVEFVRALPLLIDPDRPPVTLLARDIDAAEPERRLALVERAPDAPDGLPPAWVSEAVAAVYGYAPGARIELPIAGSPRAFRVAGVWRDYARQHGAIVIERERYLALTGDGNANEAAVWREQRADADALRQSILALYGAARVTVSSAGELRALSLRIFDRTFAVTYALEAVALLIGLSALSASFGAWVLLRRREFGMLRHVGMTRRQIGAMLAIEGALVSGLGVIAGMLLGVLVSAVLVHVVNRQAFHWSMDMHLPWLPLAAFAAVLLGLAALTARYAARSAAGTEVVRAVREDW